MAMLTVQLDSPVRRTFRVLQVAGMFDVPIEERLEHSVTAEVPGIDEPWAIGAIVGPSGSGKTTLARAAFGDCVYEPRRWPEEAAIIDCFDERMPIKEITRVLTAVGLGSVPTWLKPDRGFLTGEEVWGGFAGGILGGGGKIKQ